MKGRQLAKRLPENILFTANQLLLAARNSLSESINQITTISGEIFQQLDSQTLTFSYLQNSL